MKNGQEARLTQERLFLLDKFGPLLFFLSPLIMLIMGGKAWANYVIFLCQGIGVLYIGVFYQAKKRYLAYNDEAIKNIPSRFYRIAWGYVLLVVCIEVMLLLKEGF